MIPRKIGDQVADLYYRLAEVERRARNRKRTGKIAEIGEGENAGKYRVQLSEQGGKPYLSPWLKAKALGAGGVKIEVVRTVGEQVDVVSESGDLTDASIDLSTYSDENARANGENVPLHIKIGAATIEMGEGAVKITAPAVIVDSPLVQLGGNGGRKVARVGDMVNVGSGSSQGLWPIVEGSGSVFAVD
jgi:phage baseplate assembly protein gpV